MTSRTGTVNDDTRQSVLFLVPDLSACGDTAAARLLAAGLPPDRFRVTVGSLAAAGVPESGELEAAGVEVRSVPVRHALDVVGVRRLRRFVGEVAPVILHAWGVAAARVARLLVSRDRSDGNLPRLVVSHAAKPGGGIRGWLAARQLRRADRVIPATRADGERYRRLGVPTEQLTLIAPAAVHPPAVADREAVGRELAIPPASRILVCGGRSEYGVGPKDAIIAFDMLRYDSPDLHLAVVGAGPEARALEQFGRALAFDDFRVRFAPCPGDRVVRLAEVVLAVSPHSAVGDALGAMAAGKPVVGWATPDLAEVVEDRGTGLLVPPGDRAALAAAARTLLENAAYARRLGEAGRARAADRFSPARMVGQFARLYGEVLGV